MSVWTISMMSLVKPSPEPSAAHLGHVTVVKMQAIRTSYLITEPHLFPSILSVIMFTILDIYSINIIVVSMASSLPF